MKRTMHYFRPGDRILCGYSGEAWGPLRPATVLYVDRCGASPFDHYLTASWKRGGDPRDPDPYPFAASMCLPLLPVRADWLAGILGKAQP